MKRRSAALLLLVPWLAQAQTVRQSSRPIYRCGSDGLTLSDRPCAIDAPASAVRFDKPSPDDQRATRERARREAEAAFDLKRARLEAEAQTPAAPARLDSPRAPEPPVTRPPDPVVKAAKPRKPPKAQRAKEEEAPAAPPKPKPKARP